MGCSKDAMFLLRLYIKFKIKLLKTLDYILEYISFLEFRGEKPLSFQQYKNKPCLSFNPGLAIIGFFW